MRRADLEMIFFDAGETIVHPLPSFPERLAGVCATFGLEVDLNLLPEVTRGIMAEVEERQRKGFTFSNHQGKSRRFWLDFYSRVLQGLGHGDADGELPLALYNAFSGPESYGAYLDAAEALRELRRRGLRLGMISNFEPWLEEVLRRLHLREFFEVMVISGREEFEKPHPKIYELALERGGVEPRRALHVGDSPVSDYRGAVEAGMRAVLLDRWGRLPDFCGPRISDLRQIPSLLEEDA